MVLGAKEVIQRAPSRGRMSIMKIQSLTVQKKKSVIKVVYGGFMIMTAIILAAVNPIEIVTNWFLEMREGSFVYKMFEKPTYELFSDVWIYNYTNVDEFLADNTKKLKLEEIGPFTFQESRTNENLKIDRERGVMTFNPKISLKFLPEKSIAHYKDVKVYMPNLALMVISTFLADNFGYLGNAGAYYSMNALGSKLFINMTVDELLWGYDDPLVKIGNGLLPGWINFKTIGILDRFYAERNETAEIELRDKKKVFSLNSWNDLPGLPEQGYTDWNTSIPCNRIKGSYEGLMVSPRMSKDEVLPVFRRQACRVYPFSFQKEIKGNYGFPYNRYVLQQSAFNQTSEYACKCTKNCLPDGFVDISKCYYGFPIVLSKPHFLDTDPSAMDSFEGMHPDPEKHSSHADLEPILGVPIGLATTIQVNVAVRMNAGNPIVRPLKDKIVPMVWLVLYCKEPPAMVVNILRLRFVIAPPLLITTEVLLFVVGLILGVQGTRRILKPKYKLIQSKEDDVVHKRKKSVEKGPNSVMLNIVDNIAFSDDDELAKHAVSLLAIREEDTEATDLLISDS